MPYLELNPIIIQDYVKSKHGFTNNKGCWLKNQTSDWSYYGYCNINGRQIGIHILSAAGFLGHDLRSPFIICHKCDVKGCFNPEHLFISTHGGNHNDAIRKGRKRKGNDHLGFKIIPCLVLGS